MRFGIAIPQHLGENGFDQFAFRSYLRRAEELGFQSAWAVETTLGSVPLVAPLQAMTYAAACTDRMRLGCAVFVSTQHSPIHLANAISTLDQLSHGRVDVGIGLGAQTSALPAFGVDPHSVVTRFTEGLALMKACWTESQITFQGRFWQLRDAAVEPKPVQKPHPPVWIGGSHPDALRRAVRFGDGFFSAGPQTAPQFAAQVQLVRTELRSNGRDPAGFQIAKRVYIQVDDDRDRAVDQIERALKRGEGWPGMLPVSVAGSPADCITALRAVASAGAELIALSPLTGGAAQLERLAAEVIPELGMS